MIFFKKKPNIYSKIVSVIDSCNNLCQINQAYKYLMLAYRQGYIEYRTCMALYGLFIQKWKKLEDGVKYGL